MPFQKGRKKTGGRITGISVNKIKMDVAERLAELGCDPVQGLATIAADADAPLAVRAKCHSELLKYIKPQLRSVELTGPGGSPVEVNVSASELLARRVAELTERRRSSGSTSKPQ